MSIATRFWDRVRPGKVFYGWYIVWAGAVSNFFTIGITTWGFGVFIEQFRTDLGWSVKAIGLGYSIRSLESGLLAPFTGYIVDRLGARRSNVIGTTIMGLALLFYSQVHSLPAYFAASATMSLGQSLGGIGAFSRALMTWFNKKRGQAVGAMNTGNALGYFAPVVLASLIASLGWRETLIVGGIVVLAVGIPLALVVRDRPEDMGLLPDGDPLPPGHIVAAKQAPGERRPRAGGSGSGMEVSEVLRVPAFYLLLIAGAVDGLAHSPWVTFNIPHLQTSGFSVQGAAWIVGLYGLAQVPLRYAGGVMADKVGRRRLFIWSHGIQGVGLICFAFVSPSNLWLVPIYILVQGTAHAAVIAARDSIVADYFGTKRFATIRGLRSSMLLPVSMISPVFMGAMFDSVGSYRTAFLIVAVLGATGMFWLSLIRRPLWNEYEKQRAAREAAEAPPAAPG
jgi:MFS family permease